MRLGWLCLHVVGLALGAGCGGDKKSAPDQEALAAIDEAADDLVSRRDALLETRRALALRRAELDEKRAALAAGGADTAALDEEVDELARRERKIGEELVAVSGELVDELARQRAALTQAPATTGDGAMAAREAALARREQTLARREAALAGREETLSSRESQMALRWKESCAVGAAPVAAVPEPPRGTRYGRREVERSLRKARDAMREKGILAADLPSPLRSLEHAATGGMKKGDYAEAYFAADQLARGVAALSIDRAFVRAKFDRISAQVKGEVSDEVARLLSAITADFGEGRYAAANRRLNDLIARLR